MIVKLLKGAWFCRAGNPHTNFPIPVRLRYGAWFLAYGDVTGWSALTHSLLGRSREEREWRFIANFLKPGMTFIDVGANQGFYTILASKRVGTNGLVVAFEPAETEFLRLRRNLALNQCQNVISEPFALGSHKGSTDFFLCLGYHGSFSSIREPGHDVASPRKKVLVPITTLDDYARTQPLVSADLVKIDVEGAELDVLVGAAASLAIFRPVVVCELADIRTRQWGYPASEIYRFLLHFHYRWYRLGRYGRLEPADMRLSYDPDWENLVAIPEERSL